MFNIQYPSGGGSVSFCAVSACLKAAMIVNVDATRAIWQAEVGAASALSRPRDGMNQQLLPLQQESFFNKIGAYRADIANCAFELRSGKTGSLENGSTAHPPISFI